MRDAQEITILLVEDDQSHARLVKRNLQQSRITNKIDIVNDGQQALDYLFREEEYAGSKLPQPLLVLLDLMIPVLDGYHVLERIKGDIRTRHIPVIILTTVNDPQQAARCYDLGCNAYLSKPVSYEKFAHEIRNIGLFLTVVTIPSGE